MGFLKNLFKKKPGGTRVGNILRGLASSASGGMLGTGANRLPPIDILDVSEDILGDPSVSPTSSPQSLVKVGFFDAINNTISDVRKVVKDGIQVNTGVKASSIVGMGVMIVLVLLAARYVFKGRK